MTSLVHPRRSPRRSWGTSHRRPRHPYGCGLEGRITAWDAMGYHGMTWASMSWPVAAPAAGRRNLGGQLMGCALKEWLRGIGTLRPAGPRLHVAGGRMVNAARSHGRLFCDRFASTRARLPSGSRCAKHSAWLTSGSKSAEHPRVLASCYCTRNASFPCQNKLNTNTRRQCSRPL